MRRGLKLFLLVLFIILVSFNVVSAPEKDYTIIKQTTNDEYSFFYLEDIVLMKCGDNIDHITATGTCDDKEYVNFEQEIWESNCRLFYTSLTNFNCPEAKINFYDYENEMSVDNFSIKISKLKNLEEIVLPSQLEDGSWETPIKTAYSIWLLSHYRNAYSKEMQKALDWLKSERLNKEKCWTTQYSDEKECSLKETSEVLAYLRLSNYDASLRVVNDGQAWINTKQNIITDTPWTVSITTYRDTNCTFGWDGQEKFILTEDDEEKTFEIEPKYGREINLSCEDPISMVLENKNEEMIFYDFGYEIKYYIPGACWNEQLWVGTSKNISIYTKDLFEQGKSIGKINQYPWVGCDINATLYSNIASLDSGRKSASLTYLTDLLQKGSVIGKYLPTENIFFGSALFLKYINNHKDIRRFLVYSQNNDGSWGNGEVEDKIFDTLYVYNALLGKSFSPSGETLGDAKKWLIKNTPYHGWDDLKLDSWTYLLLKNNVPNFIQSDPIIIIMNGSDSIKINLSNPSDRIYTNLSASYTDQINGKLSISFPNQLGQFSKASVELKQQKKNDGAFYGLITIKSFDTELKKIPIIIINEPFFDVEVPEKITIINQTSDIVFNLQKSEADFTCIIESEQDILFLKNNIVRSATTLPIQIMINETKRQNINYHGILQCTSDIFSINIPIDFIIEQYPTFPSINTDNLTITKRRNIPELFLYNNFNEPINVTVNYLNPQNYFSLNPVKLELPPFKKKKIFIMNDVPIGINYTEQNKIVIHALDHEKTVDFYINLTDKDKSNPKTSALISNIIKYTIIIVIFFLLVSIVAIYIKNRKNPKRTSPKKDEPGVEENIEEGEVPVVKKIKLSPLDHATIELIKVSSRLSKKMNKSDKYIIEKLTEHGFTQEKIDYALQQIKTEEGTKPKKTDSK